MSEGYGGLGERVTDSCGCLLCDLQFDRVVTDRVVGHRVNGGYAPCTGPDDQRLRDLYDQRMKAMG